jgi:hypothetical protein
MLKKKKTKRKCNKLLLSTKVVDFTSNIRPTRTVSFKGYKKSTNKALLGASYEAQLNNTSLNTELLQQIPEFLRRLRRSVKYIIFITFRYNLSVHVSNLQLLHEHLNVVL